MKRLVINVHSGICDQIKFLAFGLAEAKRGRKVVFDTSWYTANGLDTRGRFARAWELPEAFPGLGFEWSSDIALSETDEPFVGIAPQAPLLEMRRELADAFRPALSEAAAELRDELDGGHCCAVHIRRGDLATDNEYYGRPVGADYVERACRIVKALDADARFLFFSDEPDYVDRAIIPSLTVEGDCRTVRINGSDKGHVDLFLISRADFIVGSQGSFGSVAAMLSLKSPVFITPRRSEEDFRNIPGLIYLNEDRDFEYATVPVVDPMNAKLRKKGLWKLPNKLYRHLGKMLQA